MTKKDYELITSIILISTPNNEIREAISYNFSKELASKNPRFNKDKFLKACGVSILENRECGVCGLLESTTCYNKVRCIANNGFHTYKNN